MSLPPSDVPEEHLLGQFIPLHYHFNMLRDQTRMAPFREAIEQATPLGGKVLELGGGTGVLSWFAAQRAAHVYCVERNPALVQAARTLLPQNEHGDRVEVIQADAFEYLPPEPVDVVICEMLHVGLIREKQLAVLKSFKERYQQAYGPRLPRFIPDTSLLAVQPIEQDFCFGGYHAPVPMFEPPGPHMEQCRLAEPQIYQTIDYAQPYPLEFAGQHEFVAQRAGRFNAVSFLTNNFLGFVLREQRGITWFMNQLILPIPEAVDVTAGDRISLAFQYQAGCPIESLQASLAVDVGQQILPWRSRQDLRRVA